MLEKIAEGRNRRLSGGKERWKWTVLSMSLAFINCSVSIIHSYHYTNLVAKYHFLERFACVVYSNHIQIDHLSHDHIDCVANSIVRKSKSRQLRTIYR